MRDQIDENARINVEISNLSATPDEVDQLKNIIRSNLGSNATTPTINSMSNTKRGTKYTIVFSIQKPQRFNIDDIKDWLHSKILSVGESMQRLFRAMGNEIIVIAKRRPTRRSSGPPSAAAELVRWAAK